MVASPMTTCSSRGDQEKPQGLSVARGGIEQRPKVHPDRRGLPAAQRRQLRRRRRRSPGHVGRDVAARREILLVIEERDVGRTTPEEVALEVTRDDQHAVHLPLEYRRPRGPQILDVAGQLGAAGGLRASGWRRARWRSGRDRARPRAGREPPRSRTRPRSTGSSPRGWGPAGTRGPGGRGGAGARGARPRPWPLIDALSWATAPARSSRAGAPGAAGSVARAPRRCARRSRPPRASPARSRRSPAARCSTP